MSNLQPYNPKYDPLKNKTPGMGVDYAPSYWVYSAGKPPEDDGPISSDQDADVVLIGGGFTGTATALFLAREHGIKAVVLEANQIGWGCTSRNGGQGHLAWGRLSRSDWIKKWGLVVCSIRKIPRASRQEARIPMDFRALSSKAIGIK